MQKTILITGSTDGIGLETAKLLAGMGHHILLHGRNPAKLTEAENTLTSLPGAGPVAGYIADFSRLDEVATLAKRVAGEHPQLDVLINNAGIYKTSAPLTQDGLDERFVVNALAPYLLTQRLLPLLSPASRVINLSSAAQNPVNPKALTGQIRLDDMEAYAQSKLALTMFSRHMGLAYKARGPVIVAVNPGSLLGSKMVKQGFGIAGGDLRVGAEILVRAALSDEFTSASGYYFDNDKGRFADPHADALDAEKMEEIVRTIEAVLSSLG